MHYSQQPDQNLSYEFESLKQNYEELLVKTDKALQEHRKEVEELSQLKEIIEKRKKARLRMSSQELFVLSRGMRK